MYGSNEYRATIVAISTIMSSTLHRIERGVHKDGNCGRNMSGLSSINSLPVHTNFHILNTMEMNVSPVEENSAPKTKITTSDTIVYTFSKILEHSEQYETYILLLRENTEIFHTLQTMILSCSMDDKLIFTIIPNSGSYNIKSYFKGRQTCITENGTDALKKTMKRMNAGRSSMYMVYPELTDEYRDILNSLKICSWCIPASCSHLYVSSKGNDTYDHFAYPWSNSHFSRGYTMGYGHVRNASNREKQLYIGSFAYYEKMISNVPYSNTCPDCLEMRRAANNIRNIIKGRTDDTRITPAEHKRRSSSISSSSIVALDEMNKLVDSYCK
jgi:hypothetical protein